MIDFGTAVTGNLYMLYGINYYSSICLSPLLSITISGFLNILLAAPNPNAPKARAAIDSINISGTDILDLVYWLCINV